MGWSAETPVESHYQGNTTPQAILSLLSSPLVSNLLPTIGEYMYPIDTFGCEIYFDAAQHINHILFCDGMLVSYIYRVPRR